MIREIAAVVLIVLLSWAYNSTYPPPPKICGRDPDGPPVTAPRIKLRDGRHLAYKTHGVPQSSAKFNLITLHGTSSSLHDIPGSPQVWEELGLHMVSFDRPGYGESDPDPKRTPKSLAMDVEELADQLELGSKFYLIGFSMGGQAVWGCLKYIPHRLAGVAMVAPVVNYWWPGFPANLSKQAYNLQLPEDQWALRVTHHTRCLTYWWNSQKWFPGSAVLAGNPRVLSPQDLKIASMAWEDVTKLRGYATQQGKFESLHRDLMVGFGSWEFDPMDLENPFPESGGLEGGGSVHVWQGDEDGMVPVLLQRYIATRLPWIQYHEVPGAGHLFPYLPSYADAILRSLLLGKNN
ncbi:unnamed protein product [Linum trigynum]|uniref:AB hydrolase-1 domain-containing protein n=1 Tax=Linum trigynum TaxID=586398 RepID=A0AAV2DKM4_9ROSI